MPQLLGSSGVQLFFESAATERLAPTENEFQDAKPQGPCQACAPNGQT
jgi:hypothetical protein